MPELEDRLRATLRAEADEVPPSIHPRAELDRRLAARRRSRVRVPVVAAAAAVVVAAVAVPVALDHDPPPQGLGPATAPATAPPAVSSVPPESSGPADLAWPTYLTPPTPIAWNGDHADPDFRKLGIGLNDDHEVCFLVLGADERPAGVDPLCEPLPDWGQGHYVASRSLGDLDLAMPPGLREHVADMLVFLLSPEVRRLVVRGGDGTEAPTAMVVGDQGWGFATVKFGGPYDGFGYTAYDGEGNVLEEAIT